MTTNAIPPSLGHLSATELLEGFRTLEITPLQVLDTQIERVGLFNGDRETGINAFTETLFDTAREQAAAAGAEYVRLAREGGRAPALLGLTIATKEKHGIAGLTLEQGLAAHRGKIAAVDHPVVERIKSAGGIIHARTTSPEFSCATTTHSPMWGLPATRGTPRHHRVVPRAVPVRRSPPVSPRWRRPRTSPGQPGSRPASPERWATRRPTAGFPPSRRCPPIGTVETVRWPAPLPIPRCWHPSSRAGTPWTTGPGAGGTRIRCCPETSGDCASGFRLHSATIRWLRKSVRTPYGSLVPWRTPVRSLCRSSCPGRLPGSPRRSSPTSGISWVRPWPWKLPNRGSARRLHDPVHRRRRCGRNPEHAG